jgi:hypothetical protein
MTEKHPLRTTDDLTTPPRCDSCRFWEATNGMGFCRVNPPTIFSYERHRITGWPRTKPDDWCGAWEGS